MLRAAIIGAGAIAPAHVEGLLEFTERVSLKAVVNRSIGRAKKLIERYNLTAEAFADYQEVLGFVDIVIVCTPPESHKEIAVKAFSHGCHVLIEKPMAPVPEDCDAIIYAAEMSGRILSVVAQSRFISSVYKTISIIKSGRFGRINFAQINSLWWRGPSYYDLAWRGRWQREGGGCTLNHTVHHIDLLLWAKGLPSSVTAVMGNLSHDNSEEEDISLSILEYADGTFAQITSSLVHHGEPQQLNFQMERAGVNLPLKISANKQRSNGFPEQDEDIRKEFMDAYATAPYPDYEHHTGQIADFLDSIQYSRQPLVTGENGRAAIELIMAIYKSASTRIRVMLPLEKDDPFYSLKGISEQVPHFNTKTHSVSAFDDLNITSFRDTYDMN